MLIKEYRICMPISVDEYKRGQQYMINRHSDEQSVDGEGVEVVCNKPHFDDIHGDGKFTEKRIHLNTRLPSWARSIFPAIYITEKAWNYYPYTITEYTCPILPRLVIFIETKYEDNNGINPNDNNFTKCNQYATKDDLGSRDIIHLDIAYDSIPNKSYKENEDPLKFKSSKTNRGPLEQNWKDNSHPIMCSYKLVLVKFEVWGLQTKVESFIHNSIRDILLLGHRQAFAWIDQWYDMSFENIAKFEQTLQAKTTHKVLGKKHHDSTNNGTRSHNSSTSLSSEKDGEEEEMFEGSVATLTG